MRKRAKGTAGLLVGSGRALHIHDCAELTYRQMLVVELETQLQCHWIAATRRDIGVHLNAAVAETSRSNGLLPFDLWGAEVKRSSTTVSRGDCALTDSESRTSSSRLGLLLAVPLPQNCSLDSRVAQSMLRLSLVWLYWTVPKWTDACDS